MSGNVNGSIQFSILKRPEYQRWSNEMLKHEDPGYLDTIRDASAIPLEVKEQEAADGKTTTKDQNIERKVKLCVLNSEGEQDKFTSRARSNDTRPNSSNHTSSGEVINNFYNLDTDDIDELRRQFENLRAKAMMVSLDNIRIINESLMLVERNNYLEQELAKKQNIISTWTNSGRKVQELLSSGNWKKGLGYDDSVEMPSQHESQAKLILDKNMPILKPRTSPIKFILSKDQSELGTTSGTYDRKETTSENKRVNIGRMSTKQLKSKLKDISNKNKVKPRKLRTNGKEGKSKAGNFTYPSITSRRACNAYGGSQHSCKDYHKLHSNHYDLQPESNKGCNHDNPETFSHKLNVNPSSDKTLHSAARINTVKRKGSKPVWVLKNSN